jgi:molecular chaperone GrpE
MPGKRKDRDQPTAEQCADAATASAQTADQAFSESGDDVIQFTEAGSQNNPTPELAAELAAEKDRVLRLRAEMENLRNRTSRELADERRFAPLALARDLLPVLDNVDRAIEAAEKRGDAGDLLEGFRMVRQQIVSALQQHQCTLIEAEGAPFDPQLHEAILQQPSAEVPANHVMLVTQTGYQLHNRIVRPAQVIVSSGPPAETSDEQPE